MSVDLSKIAFMASMNYMKRHSTGSTTGTYGLSLTNTTTNVAHDLGYRPFMAVGVDLFNDGIIWSNEYVHEYTQSPSSGIDVPANFRYWTTDTNLTVELRNGDGTGVESGSRNIYYVIYEDYGS